MIISDQRHTPDYIINAVRRTLRTIDCDPASNEIAQRSIKARQFYTQENSGLDHEWVGNVFLNPPYSAGKHLPFAKKLVSEIIKGNVSQAIVITSSDSSPAWFREYAKISVAICLTPRIEFHNPYAESSTNNAANFIFYYGHSVELFKKNFNFGSVYIK